MDKVVPVLYRHPDGREVHVNIPVPIQPLLLALIERAMAKKGFVRVEEHDL